MYNDVFLQERLAQRESENALRQLSLPGQGVDFFSNDYLGLVQSGLLAGKVAQDRLAVGSTGSRLLAGNSSRAMEVEEEVALFHEAPSALLFNSGYDANVGVLSAIPQRGDTILYDQLCHASIRDGIRLSLAQAFSFFHNDMTHLERRLQQASGNIFVVTESVFSMDGDNCPLQILVTLCERYGAHLIVDEAHATGVIGGRGEGLVQHLGLHQQVFCRVHTFGKACGCHGAIVLGSSRLKSCLINFARSFIYTTALPDHAIEAIRISYQLLPTLQQQRSHLEQLVQLFRQKDLPFARTASVSPIQGVLVPGNMEVKRLAQYLRARGLDVRPILSPTVPRGSERLRVVLHAFNTVQDVELLLTVIENQ